MTDEQKEQARKDAALAIRVLCVAAEDLSEATHILTGDTLPEASDDVA